MAGIIRYSTIGFIVGLCASISGYPTASASTTAPTASPPVAFYLQGTCLCDITPTPQQALGLADGYLASAGTITGIGYPAGLTFAADAAVGASAVNARLATVPDDATVTVAGLSQGAIVVNYVKLSRMLQDSLGPPTTDNLRFVTFGDPQNTTGGITTKNPALQLFAPNIGVPTRYPTTEIVREYDGFSDWPDKPTHLAVVNAVMGIAYVHPNYGAPANPNTPGTLKTVDTNAAGGVTTHYVVPTAGLPLTQPLRDAGLDTTGIDTWLRPQIDGAYVHRPQVVTSTAAAPSPSPSSPGSVPAKHADGSQPSSQTSALDHKPTATKANSSPATGKSADEDERDGASSRPVSTGQIESAVPPPTKATANASTGTADQTTHGTAEHLSTPKTTATPSGHGTTTEAPHLSTDASAAKTDTKAGTTPKTTAAGSTAKSAGADDDKTSKTKEDAKPHTAQDH